LGEVEREGNKARGEREMARKAEVGTAEENGEGEEGMNGERRRGGYLTHLSFANLRALGLSSNTS